MKDKLIAMANQNIAEIQILYGPPEKSYEKEPLLITSICVAIIAVIIGIVVVIKKKIKNKKDDENGKDVKK